MRYASIGSVSSGTLRTADLLGNFSWELNHLLQKQTTRFKRREYRASIREAQKFLQVDSDAWTPEQEMSAGDLVNELQDRLDEFAPPYGYFGTLEGDGAEFGFWVRDPRESDFDGLEVSGLEDVPAGYVGEVLMINDHGNMTLGVVDARGKFRETWAVV